MRYVGFRGYYREGLIMGRFPGMRVRPMNWPSAAGIILLPARCGGFGAGWTWTNEAT